MAYCIACFLMQPGNDVSYDFLKAADFCLCLSLVTTDILASEGVPLEIKISLIYLIYRVSGAGIQLDNNNNNMIVYFI